MYTVEVVMDSMAILAPNLQTDKCKIKASPGLHTGFFLGTVILYGTVLIFFMVVFIRHMV